MTDSPVVSSFKVSPQVDRVATVHSRQQKPTRTSNPIKLTPDGTATQMEAAKLLLNSDTVNRP